MGLGVYFIQSIFPRINNHATIQPFIYINWERHFFGRKISFERKR